MGVPTNAVMPQGLGSVSADLLNTYVQTVANLAALRAFIGTGQMAIQLQGYASQDDGGQGIFVWTATSTGPDNGTTVIVPNGVVEGAWIRDDATGSGPTGIVRCATYVVNGGGSVISTGIAGQLSFSFACTILGWTLLADQSGSVVVDIWKVPFASYPPTDTNTIVASLPPTITGAQAAASTTLTGWTTTVAANDTMMFNIDSVTSITNLTIALTIRG